MERLEDGGELLVNQGRVVQLPIPHTIQRVEKLRMLHSNQSKEILVGKSSVELVTVAEISQFLFAEQVTIVQLATPHPPKIQQQNTCIEALDGRDIKLMTVTSKQVI